MKKILKSKLGKCFLYTLLCVCVFAFLNTFIGWISYDYNWIMKDVRPKIFGFIVLNLFVDVILIAWIDTKIYWW